MGLKLIHHSSVLASHEEQTEPTSLQLATHTTLANHLQLVLQIN